MKASVIVHGPQGAGKTLLASKLAQRFGLKRVCDEWQPGDRVPRGTLCLTHAEPQQLGVVPKHARVVRFGELFTKDELMAALNDAASCAPGSQTVEVCFRRPFERQSRPASVDVQRLL